MTDSAYCRFLRHYTQRLKDTSDPNERFVYHLVLDVARVHQRIPTHPELHQYWRTFHAPHRIHPYLILSNRPLDEV